MATRSCRRTSCRCSKPTAALNLLNSPAGYDPTNPGSPVTTSIVDPDMTNDMTDEVIVGFDREVMNNFGVGVMYIYRKYDNFCGSAQQGCVGNAIRYLDSTANYTGPVAFTAACGNARARRASYTGYYFNGPTLHSNTIEENITQYRDYHGSGTDRPQAVEQSLDDERQLRLQPRTHLHADAEPRLPRSDQPFADRT